MKFRYKRMFLGFLLILFLILTLIELINYLIENSNTFGLIYLCIQAFIVFLFIPIFYNYKRYYSKERISKIIIIIIIGLFSSYFLNIVYFNMIDYVDNSLDMIDKIFVVKNYLKPLVYFFLSVFLFFETRIINKKRTK